LKKKVLLVDDVRLFLEVTKSFFSRDNLQLTVAQNGREALKTARVIRPDLIIMDLQMPEMDGADCCRELKQDPALGAIPVILLAREGDAAARERCLAAGCDRVLGKPFSRKQLLEISYEYLKITQRATPRLPIRLLVRYGLENQQTLHDYTINLSVGGIFLETEVLLPVGTGVTFEFFIPGTSQPVIGKGEVSWVNPASHPVKAELPPGLGVRFTDMTPEDERTVRGFLQSERLATRADEIN